MPDRTLLDQRAQQLRDEERIAFRVTIEERQELAPDLLPVERRLQPLLHFVSRETRERQLARDVATFEHLPVRRRIEGRVGTMRQADHHPVGIELRQQMLQRIPRRRIGPLHLVEHDARAAVSPPAIAHSQRARRAAGIGCPS